MKDGWVPRYFELSFGGGGDHLSDPASIEPPAAIGSSGWLLRGSIDLIEEREGVLRVTDYKTGRNETRFDLVVGGGEVLQPVLYSLVAEKVFGLKVSEGRLFFSTLRGGFSERKVPIQASARSTAEAILALIDDSIGEGFLPPVPREDACQTCSFRPVCGPSEERRARQKQKNLKLLTRLANVRSVR
jgi:CRISPR/Cas system-associated exonuclease Cas4 (RecB family)